MGDVSGGAKSVEGPVSRLINRPIAVLIAKRLARYERITPNLVSIVSFVMAIVAGVLAWKGSLILAGLLVQASSIVDGVDGSLARLTGRSTRSGGFLDTMLDRYADIIVYMGVGAWLMKNGIDEATMLVILAALSGDLMVSYLHTRGEKDSGIHPARIGPLDYYAGRDVRLFILAIGLITGLVKEALAVIAVITHAYVAVKSLALFSYMKSTVDSGKG